MGNNREDRSFNHCIAVLGIPGTGKSSYAAARAKEIQAKSKEQVYIIAHDIDWCIPTKVPTPGGRFRTIEVTRADTIPALATNMMRSPNAIHAYSGFNFPNLVEFALDVAARNPKGHVLLYIDEAVACEAIKPNYMSPAMKNLLSKRRHLGIGIIWTTQTPGLAHYLMMTLSTEIVMFYMDDGASYKNLDRAAVPHDVIERVKSLPDHEFIIHRKGDRAARQKDPA